MNLIYNPIFLEHDTGRHPENRKRLETFQDLPEASLEDGEPYLTKIHTQAYIDYVREACKYSKALGRDTLTSPQSFEVACKAVSATLQARKTNGFAVVRPPGHHAHASYTGGFCLFNSISIAIQALIEEGKKVLVFDFDGHFGDGTADVFYDTNQVLYFSLHQYPAFPGNGYTSETGEGKGEGYTINIPLPPGSGDDVFFDAIATFWPVIDQFKPDHVAVSAGFDAHQYDLLLNLKLSKEAFYKTGQMLSTNFTNVFATLEGGYNTRVLPDCIQSFVNGINGSTYTGDETATQSSKAVYDEYKDRKEGLKELLKTWWKL